MEQKATRDQMILFINNYLSKAAESIIKGSDIELNSNYVIIVNWINSSGEESQLLLTGRSILNGFENKGTSKVPEFITIIETKGNLEFVEKFYLAIKKLKDEKGIKRN